MRDSPELCQAEEAIQSTVKAVQKTIAVDPAATAHTVNHLLPTDLRAKYLKMYSQFPATKQHVLAGWLWIMEGCCLLQIQKPEAALEAFKKGAAVMDSMRSPGSLLRLVDSCRIVGASMALGYMAEARKLWKEFLPDATHQNNPLSQFVDYICIGVLPWWQGSTSNDTDKLAVLALMALEVASKPRGKVNI